MSYISRGGRRSETYAKTRLFKVHRNSGRLSDGLLYQRMLRFVTYFVSPELREATVTA